MNINTYNSLRKIASAYDPRIYRLVRQQMVTENQPTIAIPVNADHSLNLSGDAWYNPKMGQRTRIVGRYNSAAGLGQYTAATYLENAKRGRFPAKYFISNPEKMSEFYNLVMSLRPTGQTAVGINTMGSALAKWRTRYGDNSIGEYGKYVTSIYDNTAVPHGGDPKLSHDFHRDTYQMMLADAAAKYDKVLAKYPNIAEREAMRRVAVSHKYPGLLLSDKYDTHPGAITYLKQFDDAADQIAKYKAPRAAAPVTPVAPIATTPAKTATPRTTVAAPRYMYDQSALEDTLWKVRNHAKWNPNKLNWGALMSAYEKANPGINFNKLKSGTKINLPHTKREVK